MRAATPDWSENAPLPETGRSNPYGWDEETFWQQREAGRLHALHYPVQVTGVLVPWQPLVNLIDAPTSNPLKQLLRTLLRGVTDLKSTDEVFASAGLHTYPEMTESDSRSVYHVPEPPEGQLRLRMGVGFLRRTYEPARIFSPRGEALGFTMSCAACHASNLFGKRVIGMTNRFPRANDFFIRGKSASAKVGGDLFRLSTGATSGETAMYAELKNGVRFISPRSPMALGLDTSLAQVALSLATRAQDEYATRTEEYVRRPRPDRLAKVAADSKPAVWWNLKYKNRWLSDGSVLSGNPILTNFLWNEIGRGVDLRELERWMASNPQTIAELTTAVFSTQAPRYTDFFPAERIDEASALRGETLFEARCAKCHGHYEKAWSRANASRLPWIDRMKTVRVRYPQPTPVRDVGTDPLRWQGMDSLERALNPLAISRNNGVRIVPQKGYVPPPLVGIWARWPYMHNNSMPSLCAVLTRAADRPVQYYAGEANDPMRDFDDDCNGYPQGADVPTEWKRDPRFLYDTRREGMGNGGHDERIFLENGRELLSPEDKRDLIRYLKTL